MARAVRSASRALSAVAGSRGFRGLRLASSIDFLSEYFSTVGVTVADVRTKSPYARVSVFGEAGKRYSSTITAAAIATAAASDIVEYSIEDAIADLEIFSRELAIRKMSLDKDGMHKGGERQRIVERYYGIYEKAERSLIGSDIKPSAECCKGEIKIFCVQTPNETITDPAEEKPVKSGIVIAKIGEKVVGRLMISNSNGHDHLTLLECNKSALETLGLTAESGTKGEVLIANMIKSYFDNMGRSEEERKIAMSRVAATSCIGFYDDNLNSLADGDLAKQLLLFTPYDFDLKQVYKPKEEITRGNLDYAILSSSFLQKNLYDLSMQIIDGQSKPSAKPEPSGRAAPLYIPFSIHK